MNFVKIAWGLPVYFVSSRTSVNSVKVRLKYVFKERLSKM